MLTGDNGILKQVIKAKTETEQKSVEEQLQLAATGAVTNTSHKIEDKNKLEEELNKYGLKLDEVEENEDEEAEGWLITQGEIIYTITNNGEVRPYISPEDYGAEVTNYEVRDESYKDDKIKWKILLDDRKNIFLIASDYVKRENLPMKNGYKLNDGLEEYPKAAYFTNILNCYKGSNDIIENKKISSTIEKYHKWVKIYPNSSNDNIKAVAYMLDTDIWDVYANSEASYAIGGPSIEMFCSSYNKTHNNKTIDYNEKNDWGYSVKWSSDKNYTKIINGLDSKEDFYVINNKNDTLAMWLSSPAANEITALMCVDRIYTNWSL